MNSKQGSFALLIAVIVVIYSSVFTVDMTEHAVILNLQEYKKTISKPGLYFKIPLYQEAKIFSKQLLVNDAEPAEAITKDKKNLLVDSFSMWKIVDPLTFLQTVRSEAGAQARLNDIIRSELRVEMGTHDLIDVVSITREDIMNVVTERVNKKAAEYGIEIIGVRIKRADLPKEIAISIFKRMRTERERIANEYRSEGKEEATKIRAETDKERTILLASARQKEQEIRGEGDAKATKIYADAYKSDPKFYAFIRSMEAYKNSFKSDTTIMLSEDSDFLEFLNQTK
ncbi:MAG: protease modulator HflC [Nitrospinales bacterium]